MFFSKGWGHGGKGEICLTSRGVLAGLRCRPGTVLIWSRETYCTPFRRVCYTVILSKWGENAPNQFLRRPTVRHSTQPSYALTNLMTRRNFLLFPSHLLSSPLSYFSLLVVTQINHWITYVAGSPLPFPLRLVTCMFCREKTSLLSSLVDSR